MAMSMITCQNCGARHHYRSKCPCDVDSRSGGGSGSGKVGFILCWVALSLAFAVVISLVIWWAGEEFGRLRGTIAAAGILLLLNLFVLGMLTESWLDGQGDWDPFNHMLGNAMGAANYYILSPMSHIARLCVERGTGNRPSCVLIKTTARPRLYN